MIMANYYFVIIPYQGVQICHQFLDSERQKCWISIDIDIFIDNALVLKLLAFKLKKTSKNSVFKAPSPFFCKEHWRTMPVKSPHPCLKNERTSHTKKFYISYSPIYNVQNKDTFILTFLYFISQFSKYYNMIPFNEGASASKSGS